MTIEISPERRRRALVVGGGPVGALTALMLEKRGWEVELWEARDGECISGQGLPPSAVQDPSSVPLLGLVACRPKSCSESLSSVGGDLHCATPC